ncbi:glycosyltransferase family 4 protein [Laspinema sp. D3]|nr:glycosyltransferase family 4 protein [Laspinema sp. D2c]
MCFERELNRPDISRLFVPRLNSITKPNNTMAKRVALLTNFIPPYREVLYEAIAKKVDDFQVFISTPMEPNRQWKPNWGSLNVKVQKTLTIQRAWRHPHGFSEPVYVHIPYDTLWLLQKYQPDVLISGELGMRSLLSLLYRKWSSKCRLILWATISEYSEQGRGKLREQVRKFLLPQADAVLVNGESGARYVRSYGVAPEKIFVAPYTTEISPFTALPLSKEANQVYTLLYVGQLIERKGLLLFISALARWGEAHPDRTLEFLIVGEGSLRSTLEQQVLPPNISLSFLGNLAYSDLPQVYERGGIFVFPTLADEWGLVVNEAMAAGLPVLGSLYSQSVEELVSDGENGWIFRPDDLEAAYSALERTLSTSPEELARMRSVARSRIQNLTPEWVSDAILMAIHSV